MISWLGRARDILGKLCSKTELIIILKKSEIDCLISLISNFL
jgi:hypothetical protein